MLEQFVILYPFCAAGWGFFTFQDSREVLRSCVSWTHQAAEQAPSQV